MGTIYRCVCPDCTGYIRSEEEPFVWEDKPDENGDYWIDRWNKECKDFLSTPCPHHGDGVEDSIKF